jgi:hypothetical protein
MKLRGEDVVDGLRGWLKAELNEGPRQGYDLGKFFFSITLSTIGAIAAIERLNPNAQLGTLLAIAMGVLALSMGPALRLLYPRKYRLAGETDMLQEYEVRIDAVRGNARIWFMLWLVGSILGAVALRS